MKDIQPKRGQIKKIKYKKKKKHFHAIKDISGGDELKFLCEGLLH